MAVDTALYPAALNTTIPTASDFVSEGDDNFRQVKTCLKTTFGNVNGPVTASHTELNYVTGVTSAIQTQMDAKAPKDSPTFTTAATLPAATTIGAVTAAEILALSGVSSAIQTQLNGKGAIAGQTWTGTHDFTGGTLRAATLPTGTATTEVATTAHVASVAFSAALPGQSGNAGKFATTDGSSASWGYPILYRNYISTSATALKGFNNVITAGGITVTLPTLADGEICQITNASNTTTPIVDWGTTKFRGQTSPGLMTLNSLSASFLVIGSNSSTYGNI